MDFLHTCCFPRMNVLRQEERKRQTSDPVPEVTQDYFHLTWLVGEGDGTPLLYSCLENPMDGGACWAVVHGVPNSRTRLSDFTFTFHFHALEKAMATHSSVFAWRIPGTVEPGGLLSMGLDRVRYDWSNLAAAAAAAVACEILVPWPGIEPVPPAMEA